MKHPRNGCTLKKRKTALFNTSTGLSANQVVVPMDDIIEAVKRAIAIRYGSWQEPFRMEVVFKKPDLTAINEAVRDLSVEALSNAGEEDIALAVADHSREGVMPHHEIRAAADHAVLQLKLSAGMTYAQLDSIPPEFRGFAAEVDPSLLMAEG